MCVCVCVCVDCSLYPCNFFMFMQDTFFFLLRAIQVYCDVSGPVLLPLSFPSVGMCMYNIELSLTNTLFCELIKEFTVMDGV